MRQKKRMDCSKALLPELLKCAKRQQKKIGMLSKISKTESQKMESQKTKISKN